MNEEEIKKHKKIKLTLKIIGVILLVLGLGLTVTGIIGFIIQEMNLFPLMMGGIPCLAIGLSMTIFAFKKEIATYVKNESAPVINEYSKDLQPALKNTASGLKEGLIDKEEKIVCSCGTENDANSKFCKNCGKELVKHCPNCGKEVDLDSKFCNNCGEKID